MYLCISISLWATVFNSSSVKLFPTSLGMFSYKMQKPYYFTFKGSIEMFNTLRSFYSNSCLFCWPALFNCCVQNRFYHVLTTSLLLKSWNRELNRKVSDGCLATSEGTTERISISVSAYKTGFFFAQSDSLVLNIVSVIRFQATITYIINARVHSTLLHLSHCKLNENHFIVFQYLARFWRQQIFY